MTLSPLQQLQQLKCMTVRFGTIHDAQQVQIRNYPLLIDGVAKAVAEVDASTKIVFYSITPKEESWEVTDKVTENFKTIRQYLRTILWDDTTVVFRRGSEVLYNSSNDKEESKDVKSADAK